MEGDRTKHTGRVHMAAAMISQGAKKSEIKQAFHDTYKIKFRQSERYITRARQYLLRLEQKSREEWRGQSLQFYLDFVKDTSNEPILRLKAQERIDKLLGLEAPHIVHQRVASKVTIAYEGDDWQRMPYGFDVSEVGIAGN